MIKPYMALALQTKTYGCANRSEARKNLENICKQIDGCLYICDMEYPAKLVALPEGAITGFYDEHSRMDHLEVCRKVALHLPGEESAILAEKAKQWGIHIIAAAKVVEPDLFPDRYFNTVFIINPKGEIIHRYRKHRVFIAEGSTTPYDVYDEWLQKVGDGIDAFFPVADTEIGRIGTMLAFDGKFPEAGRALAMNGAEILYRGSEIELHRHLGYYEVMNRAHAVNNCCYVVAPNTGPKFSDQSDDHPSMTGSAGGGTMIVNYRGQVMCEVKNVNVSYAASIINVQELREYRSQSAFFTLPYLTPELWSRVYASAARNYPYPKNSHLEQGPKPYADRKKQMKEITARLLASSTIKGPE